MVRRFDLTIDCADPAALARFWAGALDYPPEGIEEDPDNAGAVLAPPDDGLTIVYFQRVPEGKVAKNRVHMDLKVGGEGALEDRKARIDAEAARLVGLGASDHRGPIAEGGSYWVRMNDPEGNEFCLVSG
ncbi:MAG: VOC family protein [Candidatus Limnocylindrales bacterium]